MNSVDGGLAEPTLAAHLACHSCLMRGHGPGEGLTQVKIAADAFVVRTIEAEHGLGVIGVDRIFDLAVRGGTFRAKVGEFHRQRLQFPKLFREADRLMSALGFLLAVIRARCEFFVMHDISILLPSQRTFYQEIVRRL